MSSIRNFRKEHNIPDDWIITQSFPSEWSATPEQQLAIRTIADSEDRKMFIQCVRKGMQMLKMAKAGGTGGVRSRFHTMAGVYLNCAQEFSRLTLIGREWEDYFPWVVFRNRFRGHKVEWIEWAAEKYGEDYDTFDINRLISEYGASKL